MTCPAVYGYNLQRGPWMRCCLQDGHAGPHRTLSLSARGVVHWTPPARPVPAATR